MPCLKQDCIILIGFMATGKSAVGKILAKKLGWKHLDCDALVERGCRMRVRRIFDTRGESYFRSVESAALAYALSKKNVVVSTGGGVVLSKRNRQRIRASGVAIWLRSSAREVLGRVRDGSRPLLNVSDPSAAASRLLKQRVPLYRDCAHVCVRSGDEPLERITNRILKRLGVKPCGFEKKEKLDR